MVVFAVIGVVYPEPGGELRCIPIGINYVVLFTLIVMLDVCDATKLESVFALMCLLVLCVFNIVMIQFFWPDTEVYAGVLVEDFDGQLQYIGGYTRNEIRRTCLTTILFLMSLSIR